MSKKINTYTGKLIYDDYGLYQILSNKEAVNISTLLDLVYHAESNYIELRIMSGSKTLFNEQGSLIIQRDSCGIFGYHINGECLESVLFFNVDNQLDIEVYSKALEGLGDTYESKTK